MSRIAGPWAGLWQSLSRYPRLAALALGVIAATGFQPLGWWPAALAAMALFAALAAEAPDVRRAAFLGWLFGVGHFTFGNNWIATAFTHQAEMPAALGWVAVPLLALYLALYPALAALGARAIAGRGLSWSFALAFGGAWAVSEMLRATVFTGYAWNPFAMVALGAFDRPGLAALAPWMGTYALSGAAVLLAAALAVLIRERQPLVALAIAVLVVAGMVLPPARTPRDGTVPFTLVQPGIEQARLSDPFYYEANFVKLARNSLQRQPGERRVVLWPESGLADYLRPGYPQRYYDRMTAFADPELARRRIGEVIGPGSVLLTGAVDLEIGDSEFGPRAIGAYNGVTALDGEGNILGGYAKAHLVPYGEYLPMRPLLEPLGLSRLVAGTIDFLPGPGARTLDLGRFGEAGVQICYEIVFSGEVVDRHNRPGYIFNPSNDGWFGSFGPPQHLAQARLRAIEEGLPVLRATTSGISAVIDARGVVRHWLPMNRSGRLDGLIPHAASPTPYARFGLLLSLSWAMAFLCAALIASPERRRYPPSSDISAA